MAGSAYGEDATDIAITEIMWAKSEYIELYNNGDTDVSLDGWKITRQKTDADPEEVQVTFGSSDTIPAHSFFLIEASENATTVSGNKIDSTLGLVDTGALLRLRDADDSLVDSANRAGSWLAGKNTAVGESMERTSPTADGDSEESWHTSTGSVGGRVGTPGEENSDVPAPIPVSTPTPTPTVTPTPILITTPTPIPTAIPTPTVTLTVTPTPTSAATTPYSTDIHINEFLPNPTGEDTAQEFIELYNHGNSPVDLSGWVLDDIEGAGSSPFSIPSGTSISAKGFITFSRTQTKISLNNDTDHVMLVRPDESVQDDLLYTQAREGHSYNRTGAGTYEQSSTVTPNAVNIFTAVVTPTSKPTSSSEEEDVDDVSYEFSSKIYINELLPNPTGTDTENEFIEIISKETKSIALFGWTLDDGDGGSSPYHFTKEESIAPGKMIAFMRSKTNISLNNDTDTVRLIDPNGKIVSIIKYDPKVVEGQSYNRSSDGSFAWSETPTPNLKNIISIQEEESPTPKPTATKKPASSKKTTSSKSVPQLAVPRVLSAVANALLPWSADEENEGIVSQTVVNEGGSSDGSRGKKLVFIFFGLSAACLQGFSGMYYKERIWQK